MLPGSFQNATSTKVNRLSQLMNALLFRALCFHTFPRTLSATTTNTETSLHTRKYKVRIPHYCCNKQLATSKRSRPSHMQAIPQYLFAEAVCFLPVISGTGGRCVPALFGPGVPAVSGRRSNVSKRISKVNEAARKQRLAKRSISDTRAPKTQGVITSERTSPERKSGEQC